MVVNIACVNKEVNYSLQSTRVIRGIFAVAGVDKFMNEAEILCPIKLQYFKNGFNGFRMTTVQNSKSFNGGIDCFLFRLIVSQKS